MKNIYSLAILFFLLTNNLFSQFVSPLFATGNAVITDFSGNNGVYAADDPVVTIIHTRDAVTNAPKGTEWVSVQRYSHPTWVGGNLGQVFGVAIDDSFNIYVAATSVYGKHNYGYGGAGAIYRLDAKSGNVTLFATLPNFKDPTENYEPGLGNICFDKKHKQFFVTNFEDGKIYRLDYFGKILDTFDPFGLDNGAAGFAPLGERLWGIASFGDTLYYSRYWEYVGKNQTGIYRNATKNNEIWSVTLSPLGQFLPNTNSLAITHPFFSLSGHTITNPISDIEFSQDGKRMLVAERTMNANINQVISVNNGPPKEPLPGHNSFAYEYERNINGVGWKPPIYFHVGILKLGGNQLVESSAGGIDYSYFPNNSQNQFDSLLWITGDALTQSQSGVRPPASVYGVQGTQRNDPKNTPSNSYLIDANARLDIQDKGTMGDVDIFKPNPKLDSCFKVGADKINFNDIICFGSDTQKLKIINCGDIDLEVIPTISQTQDFIILPPYNIPFKLKTKDSTLISVAFVPKIFGLKNAVLNISLKSSSTNLNIPLKGNLIEKGNGTTTISHNFGTLELGKVGLFEQQYFNKKKFPATLKISHLPALPFKAQSPKEGDVIPLNDSVKITVSFTPLSCGAYVDSLVFVALDCPDTMVYIFRGNATNQPANIPVTYVDFGKSVLPDSPAVTKSFVIKNNSLIPIVRKISVPKKPYSLLLQANPITILPNDSAIINITFNPSIVGDFMDSILIVEIDNCADTQFVKLRGNAVLREFIKCLSLEKTDLNFNKIYCVGEDEQALKLKNCGDTVLNITPTILDINKDFKLIPPYDSQFSIKPNDSIILHVKFTPLTFGKKNAELQLRSNAPSSPNDNVILNGEKIESRLKIDLSMADISFGATPALQKTERKIWLKNSSGNTLNINYSAVSKPFELVSPKNNFSILGNDSVEIIVQFLPQTCGMYSDTMQFFSSPCPDTSRLVLSGEGDTKLSSTLSIGTISDTIKSDRIKKLPIPIMLKTAQLLAPAGIKSLVANIKFNSLLLLPLDLKMESEKDSGKIANISVVNGRKILRLEFQFSELPKKDEVFAMLNVEPFLADSLNTTIEFDSVVAHGDCEVTTLGSVGNYKIYPTDCSITNSRLFEYLNVLKINSIIPNPINSTAEILISHQPNSPFTVQCLDIRGEEIYCLCDNFIANEKDTKIIFDTKNFASGNYQLVLSSADGVVVKNIIIKK